MMIWFAFLLNVLLPQEVPTPEVVEPLTLYTARNLDLIQPVIAAYEKETGEKVQVITGQAGSLMQKLIREGAKSPADLFITVDVGYLVQAAEKGLLASNLSRKEFETVPSTLRDKQGRWVGLSLRARTIFYNSDKVKSEELKSYRALAQPQWKGRLCLITSRKVYNQSLVAALLERHGQESVSSTLQGWVENLARPVFTSDRQMLESISQGICDVGIANTYYLARLQSSGRAANVKAFWPNEESGGVHINISGAGVVKTSNKKDRALKFIGWLLEPKAQKIFADANHEYPVVKGVQPADMIKSWGEFSQDPLPLEKIGQKQRDAVMLMDRARYL